MADPADHRIAERVDAAAIAEEVDAERWPPRSTLDQNGVARLHHPLEDRVRQRPDARARCENRRAAPPVDHELDVPPGYAFSRHLAVRPQRLEVRAPRRDERQRAVVEHGPHDDRADATAAGADAAARRAARALARAERRHLVDQVPVASGAPERRRTIFGQTEREAAEALAAAPVQLDGRRHPIRLRGRSSDQTANARFVGVSSSARGGDELGQAGELVDLLERPEQALLEIFAQARRLRAELRGDEPFLGLVANADRRGVHRDGGHEQREKTRRRSARLRSRGGPGRAGGQRQRTAGGDGERKNEQAAAESTDRPPPGARRPPARLPTSRRGHPAAAGPAASATSEWQADDGRRRPDDRRVEQHQPEREKRGAPLSSGCSEKCSRSTRRLSTVGLEESGIRSTGARRRRTRRAEIHSRHERARVRCEQPGPGPRQAPALDQIDDEADDRGGEQPRQKQIERTRKRLGHLDLPRRRQEHAPRQNERRDDGDRGAEIDSAEIAHAVRTSTRTPAPSSRVTPTTARTRRRDAAAPPRRAPQPGCPAPLRRRPASRRSST